MPRGRRPPQRFDGRVAVVTGASSGIGRAIALTLAERGALVVGLARRKELLDELAPELARRTSGSTTTVCDVGAPGAFRAALERTEAEHGRVDILVNNAGVDVMLPVPGGDDSTVHEVFDVNFFATVSGTLAVVPGMVERGWGVVVNVSSDTVRAPEPRQGAYAASKAAISAFSECVAHEVAGQRRARPRPLPGLGAHGHGAVGQRGRRFPALRSWCVAPLPRSRRSPRTGWAVPASTSTPPGSRCWPRSPGRWRRSATRGRCGAWRPPEPTLDGGAQPVASSARSR